MNRVGNHRNHKTGTFSVPSFFISDCFISSKEIFLKDIISVERTSSMKIGCFIVMRYVLVRYGTRGSVSYCLR